MTRKSSLGFIKLRPPTSPEWQSLMGPICPYYQGQFEYCLVQILAIKLWPQKNTIFYNVVTVFFSLQRKLTGKKKKKYCFKNSGPEEITPPIPLDQSSLDHLSRPYLIPETKRKKREEQSLLKSYSNHFLFITKFGKQSYRISCVYLDICMSQCVSFFL